MASKKQINNSDDQIDFSRANEDKLICGRTARKYLNCSKAEFENLVNQGHIQAYRDEYMRWKVSKESVLNYVKRAQAEDSVSYVEDEEHYTQVFKRMTEVKHSLKIATGDLKNFSVIVESDNGEEKLRLCDFFLSLVERGVHVQMVSMKPLLFYNYAKKNCPQLLENPLFELRENGHSHMKIFIFDDECAYIGSANITDAAIGKRAKRKRNNEAGMLVWGTTMMQAPLRHFEKAWNDPDILKPTWKRFTKKAKELDKELRDRYGKD